ncbi:acetolactate decarboxylase [Lacticaseibacillus brantae]|nr:acetolactate decarboxylase [Lacticaseibacillus brantae]
MNTETLYQHGTLAMLVPGLLAGTLSVADLLKHGDTGIGTLSGLNGELMIIGGVVYQMAADGQIRVVGPKEMVPFANVHYAKQEPTTKLTNVDYAQFQQAALDQIGTENIFAAVTVTGKFTRMHTRAVGEQVSPYPTLAATAEAQQEFNATAIDGQVVGYFSPELYAGVVSPGFHLHFLSSDHVMGGHILDFELESGEIAIQPFQNFDLHLPIDNNDFRREHFNSRQVIADIRKAEH